MPSIELLGDAHDPDRLIAVMLYPSDHTAREQYLAVHVARAQIEQAGQAGLRDSAEISIPLNLLDRLLDTPDYETLSVDVAERAKRGMVAGWLLAAIYLMARLSIEREPSVNKSIFALSRYAASSRFGDGTPIHRSEARIRDAWSEFQPVAHLWAAKELNRSYMFAPEREMLIPPHQIKFLQVAAGQLDFASAFVAYRAKKKFRWSMAVLLGRYLNPTPVARSTCHDPGPKRRTDSKIFSGFTALNFRPRSLNLKGLTSARPRAPMAAL